MVVGRDPQVVELRGPGERAAAHVGAGGDVRRADSPTGSAPALDLSKRQWATVPATSG